MLIDTFVNAIFLYDDKLVIIYNFREGTTTITFAELQSAIDTGVGGSDMDSFGAPCMYTQFCEKYRKWARITKATMRISHKPGDAIQVD